jgi:translation elongation factor EF-G
MILLWLGLRAKTREQVERLGRGLASLTAADPTLTVKSAVEGGVMAGAGSDAQLDAVVNGLVHEFDVEAE